VKHILIATDGSGDALKAAEMAGELAASMNATLHILSVTYWDRSEEQVLREFAKVEDIDGIDGLLAEVAKGYVEEARHKAEAKGAKAIQTSVAAGDPTGEILTYIEENKIDAVVVGRRGRSSIARLLLGSVSQKLASLAPCIVIICP
jgi:nucleotide-binding universal stress UspA family protein